MDNFDNTSIYNSNDINGSTSVVDSQMSELENLEENREPKKDGFKFVFKEAPRLVIFIISLVVSTAFFICAGVFSATGYSYYDGDSSGKPYYVTGTITESSSVIVPVSTASYSTVVYSFTPMSTGTYTFSTYVKSSSSIYSSYNNYYTTGTLFNSKWKQIAANTPSGYDYQFMITKRLNGGETYYIRVEVNNYSSYSSSSGTLYLKVVAY